MSTVEPIRKISDIRKIEKILKQENFRNLLLFDMGINFGLRISDMLSLNVEDVRNKEYVNIKEQKTGKFKSIPINSKIKRMLYEYTNNLNPKDPLFSSVYNNRMDRISAYRIIKKACDKANIETNIGTHTMRKTFGYHHYHKYKDIALLQKIFNHSSPNITLRYIGIEQEDIYNSYRNFIL